MLGSQKTLVIIANILHSEHSVKSRIINDDVDNDDDDDHGYDNNDNWKNTFCGTWYLPHSQVHNERTVPILLIMAGCIAHARNGRISTSGLKSDVTIVFLDSDFL